MDAYIEAAGIAEEKNTPLLRSAGGRGRELSKDAMNRFDVYEMVRRRAKALGIKDEINPHSFRATDITAYLESGGTIEHAQQIAAHESPRTTKLYDRTSDAISLDEIECILILGFCLLKIEFKFEMVSELPQHDFHRSSQGDLLNVRTSNTAS